MNNIEQLMSFVHNMRANEKNCKSAVSNWLIINGYAVGTRTINSIFHGKELELTPCKHEVEICYADGESFEVITSVPTAVAVAKALGSDFKYASIANEIEITEDLSFVTKDVYVMQSYGEAIAYRGKLVDAIKLLDNQTIPEMIVCRNDLQKKLESHVEFYCLPKS